MPKSENETAVEIIRSSIRSLNFNLSLCETSEDKFWEGAQEEFKLKIKKEETALEKFKISDPELFI